MRSVAGSLGGSASAGAAAAAAALTSAASYHFQADVLPYFCMYPTLWWCVGVGSFIHMAKREGNEDPSNPW